MTNKEFDILVEKRLQKIKSLLIEKGKEYRRNSDPLHNFNRASEIDRTTPPRALDGMMLKHYVSYKDILDDIDNNDNINIEQVEEKLGDLINYFILQEACIKEQIWNT